MFNRLQVEKGEEKMVYPSLNGDKSLFKVPYLGYRFDLNLGRIGLRNKLNVSFVRAVPLIS